MRIKEKYRKIVNITKSELIKFKYEKEFNTESCKLKYLFFPNKNSDKLLVIFSAFPSVNRPARYNYVESFKGVKCNKLYILDNFGPDIRGGSYYLGENKVFFIEDAVGLLIEEVCNSLRINKTDIITTGSSKGGFASLYFSFKYGYGGSVVGAPQTLLGDYLGDDSHHSYFKYITGEYNDSNVRYLNSLLYDTVKINSHRPSVFLHVGKYEHHYLDHIKPFCDFLDVNNINYELDLQEYSDHNDVGKFFPSFAIKSINSLIK